MSKLVDRALHNHVLHKLHESTTPIAFTDVSNESWPTGHRKPIRQLPDSGSENENYRSRHSCPGSLYYNSLKKSRLPVRNPESVTESNKSSKQKGCRNCESICTYHHKYHSSSEKLLAVFRSIRYRTPLNYRTFHLSNRPQNYYNKIARQISKTAKREEFQLNSQLFHASNSMNILSFLVAFSIVCNTDIIHKGTSTWIFPISMKNPARAFPQSLDISG